MEYKFTPQKPGVKVIMLRFLHLMHSGNKLFEQVHSTYIYDEEMIEYKFTPQ